MAQPARGGRRRLYCSNAHRAEARRRRLSQVPDPAPADALGATLERLAAVLAELRRQHDALRSIDPARHAVEAAHARAEATAEVLGAQRAAAASAEEAAPGEGGAGRRAGRLGGTATGPPGRPDGRPC